MKLNTVEIDQLLSEDDGCHCKGKCTSRKCPCRDFGKSCSAHCSCRADQCMNRQQPEAEESEETIINSSFEAV